MSKNIEYLEMGNPNLTTVKSIKEFHQLTGLPKPQHPLISVVDYSTLRFPQEMGKIMLDCYAIAVKKGMDFGMKYGQHTYDFDEGAMIFTAPNQVVKILSTETDRLKTTGWILFIHPDFLWNTPLANKIHKYEFFNYAVHEALFLSNKEENTVNDIINNIQQEYNNAIDKFSQDIILSQVETLLNYAERFYQRQFITRKIASHEILDRVEALMNQYFSEYNLADKGLPTVQHLASSLNISPSYLGSLLKTLTGQNTQQLIQEKLIEKAKAKLSTTSLSVSEIAYELGFEHSQSFSKMFKNKTNLSPLEFRHAFN